MPQKKQTKVPATTTTTAEPVVQETKPKKVAKKTTQKVVELESQVPPPPPPQMVKVEDVAVASKTEDEDPTENTIKEFTEFMGRLSGLRTNIANLLQDFKTLQKRTERELKTAQKMGAKRKLSLIHISEPTRPY